MPHVTFSHPIVDALRNGPLTIQTGANEITWSYGLNFRTFDTYGGEVVQILSCYTDDLTITGDVSTYTGMERIYEWFLAYIQIASQGASNDSINPFNQTPITFTYHKRRWQQQVIILELPGFRYGRDVVTPSYQIKAHIVEPDAGLDSLILKAGSEAALAKRGLNLTDSFDITAAGIGYIDQNPFSNPFPNINAVKSDPQTKELFGEIGDWYGSLVKDYSNDNFDSLLNTEYGSTPAFLNKLAADVTKPGAK